VDLAGNNIAVNFALSAGTNAVTLHPRTAGNAVNLGGADAAGTLGLTDAELDRVTAGTITIGDAATATITVTAAIQHAGDANLLVTTGRNIVMNPGSSLTTNAGNLTLSANQGTPATGAFAGFEINNATISTTRARNV